MTGNQIIDGALQALAPKEVENAQVVEQVSQMLAQSMGAGSPEQQQMAEQVQMTREDPAFKQQVFKRLRTNLFEETRARMTQERLQLAVNK